MEALSWVLLSIFLLVIALLIRVAIKSLANLQWQRPGELARPATVASADSSMKPVVVPKQVFISYRRSDEPSFTFRLYERLQHEIGAAHVFMDAKSIGLGIDFVAQINRSLENCAAVVAVIGDRWLGTAADGSNRIMDKDDFVALEVGTALRRNIRVIPVLVAGTLMPAVGSLPKSLEPLTRRNGIEVSHERFDTDVQELVVALKATLNAQVRTQLGSRDGGRYYSE